jgi:putative transcriptional regulator
MIALTPSFAGPHPIADEFLVDYAAGTAPEPIAVLVATHVALNAKSRETLSKLEAAGGALLDSIPPAPVSEQALDQMLGRLGPQEPKRAAPPHEPDTVPAPLRAYVPGEISGLPWRSLAWGLSEAVLPCTSASPYRLSLLRIGGGRAFPRHGHRGTELVLVLQGGFADSHGHYVRGDVCFADETIEHRPIADSGEDCVCLMVARGNVRFKGLLGAILNPFLR